MSLNTFPLIQQAAAKSPLIHSSARSTSRSAQQIVGSWGRKKASMKLIRKSSAEEREERNLRQISELWKQRIHVPHCRKAPHAGRRHGRRCDRRHPTECRSGAAVQEIPPRTSMLLEVFAKVAMARAAAVPIPRPIPSIFTL